MNFSLTELISIFGLILGISGVMITITRNLWIRVNRNTAALLEFKLDVAKQYVSGDRLADFELKLLRSEQRLLTTLEHLSSRIDRMLERMEK